MDNQWLSCKVLLTGGSHDTTITGLGGGGGGGTTEVMVVLHQICKSKQSPIKIHHDNGCCNAKQA